jgi:hypothetical protein
MNASPAEIEASAEHVEVTSSELIVGLTDGRRIQVPLAWFPTLLEATEEQRGRFEIFGDGQGIHWPLVDADISVVGLLLGIPDRSRR